MEIYERQKALSLVVCSESIIITNEIKEKAERIIENF
jgi:hypothetical protein